MLILGLEDNKYRRAPKSIAHHFMETSCNLVDGKICPVNEKHLIISNGLTKPFYLCGLE